MPRDAKVQKRVHPYTKVGVFTIDLPDCLRMSVHVSSREILVDHCRPLGSLLECEHKCISLGAWNALCEDPRVYNDIL